MEHQLRLPVTSEGLAVVNANDATNDEGNGTLKNYIDPSIGMATIEETTNGTANNTTTETFNGYTDDIENGINHETEDHVEQYRELQERLAAAESSAATLLDDTLSLHNTLAYYTRRNTAILRLLLSFGCTSSIPGRERIAAIAEKTPRLAQALEPALLIFNEDATVSSLHWLNLILTEGVAEMLQDDVGSISDPLSLASWASTRTTLIPGDYTPLHIPASGVNSSYSGNTWNLDVEH